VKGNATSQLRTALWETFLLCAVEFKPVGTELVVVELSAPASWVFRFSDGKIAYWKAYMSRATALQAVGLSE
jgi:hypothetical protein